MNYRRRLAVSPVPLQDRPSRHFSLTIQFRDDSRSSLRAYAQFGGLRPNNLPCVANSLGRPSRRDCPTAAIKPKFMCKPWKMPIKSNSPMLLRWFAIVNVLLVRREALFFMFIPLLLWFMRIYLNKVIYITIYAI